MDIIIIMMTENSLDRWSITPLPGLNGAVSMVGLPTSHMREIGFVLDFFIAFSLVSYGSSSFSSATVG